MSFYIAHRRIGTDAVPFVIAEMSGNHNQSLERALQIVDSAARAGVHAIKIQTYTADTMTLDLREGEFILADKENIWQGRTLYELYAEAHTPLEWHAPIFERARELGVIPFSTPFDASAVDYLETLDVACYKIASFENTDLPLIRKVAATGKPLIISTGMADLAELDESVRAARESGCKDLVLLQCTSTYPATPLDSNLLTIPHMRESFCCETGLSDHTMGIGASVASVALGACVIEKHFTLDRADGGVDATFSMEPAEMAMLVVETERAWQSLGRVKYGPSSDNEFISRGYRRSLYIVRDMEAGEALTSDNLRAIRPGLGLPTKYYSTLLGKCINQAVRRGTPVGWNLIG
jgi:pseudaminic acid synthase